MDMLLRPCDSPCERPDDINAQSMQSLHHNLQRHTQAHNTYTWAGLGVLMHPRSLQQGLLLAGLGRPTTVCTPSQKRSFVLCRTTDKTHNTDRLRNIGSKTSSFQSTFRRVQVLSKTVVLSGLYRYVISDGIDAIAVFARENLCQSLLRYYSCMLGVVELPDAFRSTAREGKYPGKIVVARYFMSQSVFQEPLFRLPYLSDFVNDWRAYCANDIQGLRYAEKKIIHACILESRTLAHAKCCAIRVFDGTDTTWMLVSDVRFDCFLHLRSYVVNDHVRRGNAIFAAIKAERMSELERATLFKAVEIDYDSPFGSDPGTIFIVRNIESVEGVGGYDGFTIEDDDVPLVDTYFNKPKKTSLVCALTSPDIMTNIMKNLSPWDIARMANSCWSLCVRVGVWNTNVREETDETLQTAAHMSDVAVFIRTQPPAFKASIFSRMHHSVTVQALKLTRHSDCVIMESNNTVSHEDLRKAMTLIMWKFDPMDLHVACDGAAQSLESRSAPVRDDEGPAGVDYDTLSEMSWDSMEDTPWTIEEQRIRALFTRNVDKVPTHLSAVLREAFVRFVGDDDERARSVSLQRFCVFPHGGEIEEWKEMAQLVMSVSPIAVGVLRFIECSVIFTLKNNFMPDAPCFSTDPDEHFVDINHEQTPIFDPSQTHFGVFVLWQQQVAFCAGVVEWPLGNKGYGDKMVYFETGPVGGSNTGSKKGDWKLRVSAWEHVVVGFSKHSSLVSDASNAAEQGRGDFAHPFYDDDHLSVWVHDCDRIAPVVVSRGQWLAVTSFIQDLHKTSNKNQINFGITVQVEFFSPSISVHKDTKSVMTSLHAKTFRVHGVIPSPASTLFDFHASPMSNTSMLKTFLTHKKFKGAAQVKKQCRLLATQDNFDVD